MIYSYSRLKKFDPNNGGCPDRFYRVYVLGEDEPANEPMAFGKAVHTAIEQILKNKAGMAEAAITGALEAEKETEIYVRPDEVMNLLKWLPKVDKTAFIEQEIILSLGDSPFTPKVRFIPDVLISNGELIDWKSGWGASDPMQLKVYAYLAKKSGYDIKKARIINLRNPKRNQEIEINQLELDEAEIWLLQNILEIESRLERLLVGEDAADVFPPIANAYCKSCSKLHQCTNENIIKQNSAIDVQPAEIESMEEAKNMANQILQMESLLDSYKDALKKYVEKNGEVPIGTKKFCFVPTASWSFDGKQLKELMENISKEHGIDYWDYLDFGSNSRKNMAKKLKLSDKQIEELLKKYGKLKTSKQFKCITIENDIATPAVKAAS